jgi:hypothetical protein
VVVVTDVQPGPQLVVVSHVTVPLPAVQVSPEQLTVVLFSQVVEQVELAKALAETIKSTRTATTCIPRLSI